MRYFIKQLVCNTQRHTENFHSCNKVVNSKVTSMEDWFNDERNVGDERRLDTRKEKLEDGSGLLIHRCQMNFMG